MSEEKTLKENVATKTTEGALADDAPDDVSDEELTNVVGAGPHVRVFDGASGLQTQVHVDEAASTTDAEDTLTAADKQTE